MTDKYIVVDTGTRVNDYAVLDTDTGQYVNDSLYAYAAHKIADTMNARITERANQVAGENKNVG